MTTTLTLVEQVKRDQAKKKKECIPRPKIQEFQNRYRHSLVTTRFTNTTWNENQNGVKTYENYKCVYCSPCPMAKRIVPESIVFVLEMNNDTNQIMGIGMIQNKPNQGKRIYEDNNYNRFTYFGKYRIDRKTMTETEETIMAWLDKQCFYGKKHLKRGQGLTAFPFSTLYKCLYKTPEAVVKEEEAKEEEAKKDIMQIDIIQFITEMFKRRFK